MTKLKNCEIVTLHVFLTSDKFRSLEFSLKTRLQLKEYISKLNEAYNGIASMERELKRKDENIINFENELKEAIKSFTDPDTGNVKDEFKEQSSNLYNTISEKYKEHLTNYKNRLNDWNEFLGMDSEIPLLKLKRDEITIPSYVKMNSHQWDILDFLFEDLNVI